MSVATTFPYDTVGDMRSAHETRGMKWFNKETVRHFGSRFDAPRAGGFFISSELDMNREDRRYTVRRAMPDGDIDTVSEFREFATKAQASKALAVAQRAARRHIRTDGIYVKRLGFRWLLRAQAWDYGSAGVLAIVSTHEQTRASLWGSLAPSEQVEIGWDHRGDWLRTQRPTREQDVRAIAHALTGIETLHNTERGRHLRALTVRNGDNWHNGQPTVYRLVDEL